MGGSQVTEMVDFSGGMNTLLAAHLIGKNEARGLVNTDIRFGALQSMPNLDHVQSLDGGPFFYQYLRKVYSYPTYRTNVLWDNKWYWSDGAFTGKVMPDGSEYPLGLPTPANRLLAEIETGDGPLDGNLKYTYTFYNVDTGVESAPAPISPYVVPVNQNVRLTGFEALPAAATHYRIYRIGGYLPFFMLVGKTTSTDYIDDQDDSRIEE